MKLNSQKITQVEGVSASELIEHFKQIVENTIKEQYQQKENPSDNKLMTRKEVAELFGISLPTVWAWTKNDVLKSYRIGNKLRYKKSEVLGALQSVNSKKS